MPQLLLLLLILLLLTQLKPLKLVSTAPFWVIMQRVMISYRRFGTTSRSHLQGSTVTIYCCLMTQESAVLIYFATTLCRMLAVASNKLSDSSSISWLCTGRQQHCKLPAVSRRRRALLQVQRGVPKPDTGSEKRGAQREAKPSTAFMPYWPWYCCRVRARPWR